MPPPKPSRRTPPSPPPPLCLTAPKSECVDGRRRLQTRRTVTEEEEEEEEEEEGESAPFSFPPLALTLWEEGGSGGSVSPETPEGGGASYGNSKKSRNTCVHVCDEEAGMKSC